MAYSNFYSYFYSGRDRWRAASQAIFRFRPSRIYLIILGVLQLGAWFEAWFIKHNLSGEILVLHYNVDSGIDLIGDPARVYLYPLAGLGVIILNFLGLGLLTSSRIFKTLVHFLFSASVFFAAFLNVALFAIYLINFR